MENMEVILEVRDLSKSFPIKSLFGKTKKVVSAVNQVSFSLKNQGTLGIVGESGCGKSTVARLLLRLIEPDAGEVVYEGDNILSYQGKQLREMRQNLQMVFQNPYSSLNPKMTVLDNVAFNLWVNGKSKRESRTQALRYLDAVGLPKSFANRYPTSLSGGQRQRVAIARALVLQPHIIVADEAVSALDKSVQAQVLNLFQDLKEEFSLSLVFISHDLNVVEYMSDEVMVMYLGRVVEKGPAEEIYARPYHPYTQALMKSAPSMDVTTRTLNKQTPIQGELPSPLNPPSGCRFRTRCPLVVEQCAKQVPVPVEMSPGHQVACILYEKGSEGRVVP